MASRGDIECFIIEVASYNFLLCDKASKEYKSTEMKICVNYILMNIGTAENKGVISKKKIKFNCCIQQIQSRTITNAELY